MAISCVKAAGSLARAARETICGNRINARRPQGRNRHRADTRDNKIGIGERAAPKTFLRVRSCESLRCQFLPRIISAYERALISFTLISLSARARVPPGCFVIFSVSYLLYFTRAFHRESLRSFFSPFIRGTVCQLKSDMVRK